MSSWSPNNGTHPKIRTNNILMNVVEDYYDVYERHERIDMVENLEEHLINNHDIILKEYIEGKIEVGDLKNELDEALEFYLERNPYFYFDW